MKFLGVNLFFHACNSLETKESKQTILFKSRTVYVHVRVMQEEI